VRKCGRQAILDRLVAERGGWVPAIELSRLSIQYSARIHEIRKLGFAVENRTEHVAGKVHGFYRLALGVSQPAVKPAEIPQPKPQPREGSLSLFGDISPERSYPD
jgi:hypothetical protein